jgi:hypothetical protein
VIAGFDVAYEGWQAVGMSLTEWKKLGFGWADWQKAAVSGDGIDPDGDGVPNLVKYVLGRRPRQADGSSTFRVNGDAHGPTYDFDVRFKRNRNAVDAGVEIEVSSDLVTWYDGPDYIGGTNVVDDGNGLTETAQVQVRSPDPEKRKAFVRLRTWRR